MDIQVGKHSGFCMGVSRAVQSAIIAAKQHGTVYVLGELIHNNDVNDSLRQQGVYAVQTIDELPPKCTVIIRSHGVGKKTCAELERRGHKIIDTTCVFVKKIHSIVQKHYADGYNIIIIGSPSHPEVMGINGWCNDSAVIIDSLETAALKSGEKYCVVVQTTYSQQKFEKVIKNLDVDDTKIVEIFNTICYTTIERQKETVTLSENSDCVIVLGGKHSSNTQKLFELASSSQSNPQVIAAERLADINFDTIRQYKKVAIVAGASTPKELIKEVYSRMEQLNNAAEINNETLESEVTTEQAAPEVIAEDSANAAEVLNDKDTASIEQTEAEEMPAQEVSQAEADEVTVSQEVAEQQPEAEKAAEETVAQEPVKDTEKEPISTMEQALAEMDKEQRYRRGQVVSATISLVEDDALSLAVGLRKKDIQMDKSEVEEDGSYDKSAYNVGDIIEVVVVEENPLKVSRKQHLVNIKDDALIEEIKDGKIFTVKVTGHNKGGLTGRFGSFTVFIPASHIRLGFVKPEDFDKYTGKELKLKLVEVKMKTLISSAKKVIEEERAKRDEARAEAMKAFFASIDVGQIVEGKVVRFTDFGAFVNVNGFDCLAHISDLAWTNVKKADDILEKDSVYEFVILKIDQQKEHVSLGYKQLQPKPWDLAADKYPAGSTITGKVVRIAPFGAFVEVEPGIDGLVHVSQITHEWIENPASVLKAGDEVEAKVLEVRPEAQKLTLSIKALMPEPEGGAARPPRKSEGEDGDRKPRGERKPRARKEDMGLREWEDDSSGGASIGDLLKDLNIDLD